MGTQNQDPSRQNQGGNERPNQQQQGTNQPGRQPGQDVGGQGTQQPGSGTPGSRQQEQQTDRKRKEGGTPNEADPSSEEGQDDKR
jgi:hypothetical protein